VPSQTVLLVDSMIGAESFEFVESLIVLEEFEDEEDELAALSRNNRPL